MPVWTPGSYAVDEFERNVQEFSAYGEDGSHILWEKVQKNVWRIKTADNRTVRARYRVYAYEYTVETSYLDIDHAVLNAASSLMYPEGYEKQEIMLRVIPFRGWKCVSTGLERYGNSRLIFVAPNYDTLVDSPIVIGNQEVYSFTVGGVPHEVAIFGAKNNDNVNAVIDTKRFISDLKRIVEASIPVYGEMPHDRYVFLIDITGNKPEDGLEHHNSTYCHVQRSAFEPKNVYHRMLGLFGHEYFHLWNVKRMRPANLGPFNYGKENYTKLLWVSEGITTYYEHIILRRANIYTVPEYLDSLADQFNRYLATPGRKVQSAEESSFDTWVKFCRPNENTINTVISYYTIGCILGWMLDMAIRHQTDNTKTLDNVMQRAYTETYKRDGRGYTYEEFHDACERIAGTRLDDIFENHVRGTKEIDFDYYLGFAGLKLEDKKSPSSKKNEGEKQPSTKDKGFLGVKLKLGETGRITVESVLVDTPAYRDGLYAKDEIIAADGNRTDDQKTLSFYVENREPGSTIRLTVSRDGKIRNVKVYLGSKPVFLYRIQRKEKATASEKKLFSKWLDQDWDKEIKYEEERAYSSSSPAADRLFFNPSFV
jgi:predicted metalloprotease with PDZ domain